MKILQKRKKVVYRWRCEHCGSLLEDDEFHVLSLHDFDIEKLKSDFRHNCPVCVTRDAYIGALEGTLHKYALMEDGTEYEIW